MADAKLPDWAGTQSWSGRVGPEDIDENGHMNVLVYDRVLDEIDRAMFLQLGWTPAYPQVERRGFFRVEKHMRYESELMERTPLLGTGRILFTDLKRFHLFFQLWNATTGQRSAFMETMVLHMNLEARRVSKMESGPLAETLLAAQRAQADLPMPPGTRRRVSTEPQPAC
ncbi:thioesterase family protein [Oceanicola sp. S124]|uniref:thioesterase family protein n=1 Tax=Oceanicola sp. S124 TaxID=1042378 RepID=UPI0002557D3A|nr:thioesterase family protein [Oceanicola sp. S124]